MSQYELLFSSEGHQWTKERGLQEGLATVGVIHPRSNQPSNRLHDVVVLGAGYAGLTAARDLSTAGYDVLLLEGRDRVGGRTWSTNIEGHPYEVGGTWLHWHQPFVWRELARYGMAQDLEVTPAVGYGVDQAWLHRRDGSILKMSHDEEATLLGTAMKKFIDVDGKLCREVMPFPHNPKHNPKLTQYDKMSFADRIEQIRHLMTPVELELLEAYLSITSGGTMENSSFLEIIRWWALNNYDMGWLNELCLTYHLKLGQSEFARRMFEEAVGTGRVTYQFGAVVSSVEDQGKQVMISCRLGQQFKARRAISTVPLNVLSTIKFSPELSAGKKAAANQGHVNHCIKLHAEVANPALRTFSGWMVDRPLAYAFGDGTTPAGNTHLVAFGPSVEDIRLDLKANNGRDAKRAVQSLAPDKFKDVVRLVFHDWNEDEFARGTWAFLPPGLATEHVDELKRTQGNVLFANSDWATGWRGFIDGAIEEGARAAKELQDNFEDTRPRVNAWSSKI